MHYDLDPSTLPLPHLSSHLSECNLRQKKKSAAMRPQPSITGADSIRRMQSAFTRRHPLANTTFRRVPIHHRHAFAGAFVSHSQLPSPSLRRLLQSVMITARTSNSSQEPDRLSQSRCSRQPMPPAIPHRAASSNGWKSAQQ